MWQACRYERKFLISEGTAAEVRRFVTAYLSRDEYMRADEPKGYLVHSLYLDTPQWTLYRLTTEGVKNRYKLRIRFYDAEPRSPAFLEIKTRIAEAIHKQRAAVSKQAAERLLQGQSIGCADLLATDESSVRAFEEFCRRRARLCAEPAAFVSFWREAYASRWAEGLRVTFDREIHGEHYRPGSGLIVPEHRAAVAATGVVLELKYKGRVPHWMQDLVTTFNLERTPFPKYVHCIDALKLTPAGGLRRAGRTRSVPC